MHRTGGESLNTRDVRELRRVLAENRKWEERCARLEAERDEALGELKVACMHSVREHGRGPTVRTCRRAVCARVRRAVSTCAYRPLARAP